MSKSATAPLSNHCTIHLMTSETSTADALIAIDRGPARRPTGGSSSILSVWVLLALLLPVSSLAAPPAPAQGTAGAAALDGASSRDLDAMTRVDANQIDSALTNYGSFGYDLLNGLPGVIYPIGGQNTVLFAGGLWLGAKVGGETRVTVAEYSFEYGPGIIENGGWADPSHPRFRTYKIEPGDTPQNSTDYAEWPDHDGAPVDEMGLPRIIGDQTLWSVYNDLDPSRHANDAGRTAPLGVEVQQTTFALDGAGSESEQVFFEWKIINKGGFDLEEMYLSLWSDPDLGGAGDDYVGCDPEASLGFCYNATNNDNQYGSSPPAVGIVFLQGPIVPSPGDEAYVSGRVIPDFRNLELSSFNRYINGIDPQSFSESYNYMQGLNADGSDVVDPTTGQVTRFVLSGDPVTGTGWIDFDPADRRMMLSVGPFEMAAGDTQIVAAALVTGQGEDNLSSVTALRGNTVDALSTFRTLIEGAPGACCDGFLCTLVPAVECDGLFRGGEVCSPNPCFAPGPGACCFPNGSCAYLLEEDCSGTFFGSDSICDPNPCEEFGPDSACCLGDGECTVLSELLCLSAGGTYLPGATCELTSPADPRWDRNFFAEWMFDEIAGPGGIPVPADERGGPGNQVWLNDNSTGEWRISAGGGSGTDPEGRFARNNNESRLSESDLILRWDEDPDNIGVWIFNGWEAATIPFGLYREDPQTGQEERLIPCFFSDGGTSGIYDISPLTEDPVTGWPATDWGYAYTGDYDAVLADGADGQVDDTFLIEDELFARMIFASATQTLPAVGTVIRFVTTDKALDVGTGFDAVVPLGWSDPGGIEGCFPGEDVFEVRRNGAPVANTSRFDYLYRTTNGTGALYSVVARNPQSGQSSEVLTERFSEPMVGGYEGSSAWTDTAPVVDGVLEGAWNTATRLSPSRATQVFAMNDGAALYLALETGLLPSTLELCFETNGDDMYDENGMEGCLEFEESAVQFVPKSGTYPDVISREPIVDPEWLAFGRTEDALELRLDLSTGPLASREKEELGLFLSIGEEGAYPPGPKSVLEMAPELFATVALADGSTSSVPTGILPTRSFPNPMTGATTLAYRLASEENVAVDIFDAQGRRVRALQPKTAQRAGTYALTWDGRNEEGAELPSGVYFYRVEGDSFLERNSLTLVR